MCIRIIAPTASAYSIALVLAFLIGCDGMPADSHSLLGVDEMGTVFGGDLSTNNSDVGGLEDNLTADDTDGDDLGPDNGDDLGSPSGANQAQGPIAHIDASPLIGTAPLNVAFQGGDSESWRGPITEYSWGFGDGAVSEGAEVYHRYAEPGVFSAQLTVVDRTGGSDSARVDVAVLSTFTITSSLDTDPEAAPLTVRFTADSVPEFPDGLVDYCWDFGDGAVVQGRDVRHTFARSGTYTVTLSLVLTTLNCARNQTVVVATETVVFAIVADAGNDQTASGGDLVTLDGAASHAPDPSTPLIYHWAQTSGPGVTLDEPAAVAPTFVAPTVGSNTDLVFTLTVTDGSDSASDAVTVTVLATDLNALPMANAGPDQTLTDSDGDSVETVTLDGSASYDPDGDIVHYRWMKGLSVLTEGATATASVELSIGSHTLTLEVTDDRGATNTDTVVVTILHAGLAGSVSQHGITWTFDGEYQVGQFVNGDWWVVGPATIVSVSPAPTFDPGRSGSVINPVGRKEQGYDDRGEFYSASLAVAYPLTLQPGQSLVSTESRPDDDANQPDLLGVAKRLVSVKLKRASVLTCVASPIGPTMFRPPYAGNQKPLFDSTQLRIDLLPNLTLAGGFFFRPTPEGQTAAQQFARYFERPWIMHQSGASGAHIRPLDNCPCYYRECHVIESEAALILCCDVLHRQELLINFVQYGIDSHYVCKTYDPQATTRGDRCLSKWPGIFAGIMLDHAEMRLADNGYTWFKTDALTYRGTGWTGETALFSVSSDLTDIHEQVDPFDDDWCQTLSSGNCNGWKAEAYRRSTHSHTWVGTALAARLMNATGYWNHDVFFDYCDRWMTEDESAWFDDLEEMANNDPCGNGKNYYLWYQHGTVPFSPFTKNMWDLYR